MSAAAPRMLRALDIEVGYAIPRSTIYHYLKNDPAFPKPIRFSERNVRWEREAIEAWVASRRDTAPAA